jgi:hypothetical protein
MSSLFMAKRVVGSRVSKTKRLSYSKIAFITLKALPFSKT